MFTSTIKIPFHLCDPAKILFFGSLYEIYHQFLENHIDAFDISWEDWFKQSYGAPIRGLKTSYNRPLAFGKTYKAHLKIKHVGESTVTFLFEVEGENKAIHVTTEVTHCFVDSEVREKMNVPTKIKEAFLKHLQS